MKLRDYVDLSKHVLWSWIKLSALLIPVCASISVNAAADDDFDAVPDVAATPAAVDVTPTPTPPVDKCFCPMDEAEDPDPLKKKLVTNYCARCTTENDCSTKKCFLRQEGASAPQTCKWGSYEGSKTECSCPESAMPRQDQEDTGEVTYKVLCETGKSFSCSKSLCKVYKFSGGTVSPTIGHPLYNGQDDQPVPCEP